MNKRTSKDIGAAREKSDGADVLRARESRAHGEGPWVGSTFARKRR
jgi:hypothetical protein